MSEEATLDEFVQKSESGEQSQEWIKVQLNDVANKRSDNVDPQEIEIDKHVGLEHIEPNNPIPGWESTEGLSSTKRRFNTGDILFAKLRPNLEKSAQPDFDGVASTDIFPIVAEQNINSKYLLYRLSSKPTFDFARRTSAGTRMPRTSWNLFSNFEFTLPPLSEQRKIAIVLYTVDYAIEKTKRVIEKVRTVKQGMLQDLMKGAGSDRPLEEKRVGPRVVSLPEDWEVVQIGDALERDIILEQQDGNHGSDYPRKNEFVDEGVPYLSAEMLSEGEVDFSQAKYLTEQRANQLRIGFAKDGDVLLAHNATVGPAGLLETVRDFVIIGTSLTYYRCNSEKLNSQYLTYFFQSGTFQKQLKDVMRQSTRNQVPITRQKNLHLILPPIQQQRGISDQIDTVIEKLRTEKQYQEQLKRLKQGLMQDLLSGKVRTTDTNIEVPEHIMQHG